MIARTLFFSIPGHLGVNLSQLVYTPAVESGQEQRTFPIEDVGFIVIETPQMTLTAYALQALAENNTAVIYSPIGMAGAWELSPNKYSNSYLSDDALKLGVNMLMYSSTR